MKTHTRILLIGILLLSSCTVREDRALCPCRLEVDLSGFAVFGRHASVAFWEGTNARLEDAYTDSSFVRAVIKDAFDASVWCNVSEGRISGSRLIALSGAQPDSLRAFKSWLDCTGETCTETAVPHRQFARITLKVCMEPGTHYPYVFYVESDYNGLDLRDFSPVRGNLVFPVRQTEEDTFVFNLLRHGPDTMVRIGIYDETERADELPLHEWMRAAGYDWDAPDLEDITLYLDYVHQKIRIIVSNWQEGEVIEADI